MVWEKIPPDDKHIFQLPWQEFFILRICYETKFLMQKIVVKTSLEYYNVATQLIPTVWEYIILIRVVTKPRNGRYILYY